MNQPSIKKGFTLIELLVVIAIIGILTAIISANFTLAKSKARDAKRISDLAQIQLAFELAFDKCGTYPSSLSVTNVCDGYAMRTFISPIPADTYRGEPYGYEVDDPTGGTAYDYRLKAKLENASSRPGANPEASPDISLTCTDPTDYCVSPK